VHGSESSQAVPGAENVGVHPPVPLQALAVSQIPGEQEYVVPEHAPPESHTSVWVQASRSLHAVPGEAQVTVQPPEPSHTLETWHTSRVQA
jgi:hypothetical protein